MGIKLKLQTPNYKIRQNDNQIPESKKPQKQKAETHAECGIANFSLPGCQQSMGLIKIHQTSIRNKPITLFNTVFIFYKY